jgi:hypothetical protein
MGAVKKVRSIKWPKAAAGGLLFLYVINFTIFPPQAKSKGLALHYDVTALETGDFVFRRGRSLISQMVLSADSSSSYSHVGIIMIIEGNAFVAHTTTGEPPIEDVARVEPLDVFLRDDRASAAAVYRLKDSARHFAVKAVEAALSFAEKRVPFDDALDLSTSDKLYCTEMVWRAYLAAGLDLVNGQFDRLDVLFGKDIYLLPSSLLESEWLEMVCSIRSTR